MALRVATLRVTCSTTTKLARHAGQQQAASYRPAPGHFIWATQALLDIASSFSE